MGNANDLYAYLTRISQLSKLHYEVQERLHKGMGEIKADFEKQEIMLANWFEVAGLKREAQGSMLDKERGHLRRYQANLKALKRQSRAMMFAIGFSAFEKFLEERFRPSGKGNSMFLKLEKHLQGLSARTPYFGSSDFHESWKKADNYRKVRNVIVHQAGLFDAKHESATASDKKTSVLLVGKRADIFAEDVDYPKGFKEVVIGENQLPEILDFFQTFALRIEAEASGSMKNANH